MKKLSSIINGVKVIAKYSGIVMALITAINTFQAELEKLDIQNDESETK